MAHRAPRFAHLHAARDVGASAITLLGGRTAHADFPVDNLIDGRAGTLFKFSQSYTNPWIVFDLGVNFVTGIDRLIIPADNNVNHIIVGDDDNVGMTSYSQRFNAPVTAGTQHDATFGGGPTTQRYVGIRFTGTYQYYLPQIFLTTTVTLSAGPNLENSIDSKKSNVTRSPQPTGLLPTVQHGPDQRVIEYVYDSPLEGADLTKMEALVDYVGLRRSFYVDPTSFSSPPEDDEPALAMKFTADPPSRNSILVPESGERSKTYRLPMIESVD